MVSTYKIENTKIRPDGDYVSVELRGLSTDTKPTTIDGKSIDNGSIYIEIDTQKIYFFDLDSKTWKAV